MVKVPLRMLAATAALAAACASAAPAPSRMMANVYRFAEAGAVLEICFASEVYKSLPEEKAARLQGLARRIEDLVGAIAKHYRDEMLVPTYDGTRGRIAGGSDLRLYVKNHYRYCGDNLASGMEAFVAENEALLNGFFSKEAARKAAAPAPAPK